MRTKSREKVDSASRLVLALLPDLILAIEYAKERSSHAREGKRVHHDHNSRRPFHTSLWVSLNGLQRALAQLLHLSIPLQNNSLLPALVSLLDLLEDNFLAPNPESQTFTRRYFKHGFATTLFKMRRTPKSREHNGLRDWLKESLVHTEDKATWLLRSTRFDLTDATPKLELLEAVETCRDQVQLSTPVTPFRDICLEDDTGSISHSALYDAWSRIETLCKRMEDVHSQLKVWTCNCVCPHQTLHFAIDPCYPLDGGQVWSSILHNDRGWKKTVVRLKCAKNPGDLASYQELCHDLGAASVERPWYTVTNSNPCDHPLRFEQLCDVKVHPPMLERVCLAVVVSHIYLHLGGGQWWPYSKTDQMIQFQGGRKMKFTPTSAPIFAYSRETETTSDCWPKLLNAWMPNLASLGKLILEIITWRVCSWEDLLTRMKELEDPRTDIPYARRILAAVEACIGYRESRLRSSCERDTIRQSSLMRDHFIELVIRNLEAVSQVWSIDASDIFSAISAQDLSNQEDSAQQLLSTEGTEQLGDRVEDRSKKKVRFSRIINTTASFSRQIASPVSDAMSHFGNDTATVKHEEEIRSHEADEWATRLVSLQELLPELSDEPIKVAVLDTGLHFNPNIADRYPGRYQTLCFMGDTEEPEARDVDENGHGTHMASIILDIGTNCHVYACRINAQQNDADHQISSEQISARIAKAIRYAVDRLDVDIITMSCGFVNRSEEIAKEIAYAHYKHVLVVAGAGNKGDLEEPRYPARDDNVLCIYASTGYGNSYRGNPTPRTDGSRFVFPGVDVKGHPHADADCQLVVRKSGTSPATATAAGVAALVLQIMRCCKDDAVEVVGKQAYLIAIEELRGLHGMRKAFQIMCDTRGRGPYDVVKPWQLLPRHEGAPARLFCERIVNAMDVRRTVS